MKILNNLAMCLILCLNFSILKVNGQNCTWINSVLDDAKEINALQLAIDEIVFKDGIVVTADDPTFITYGEYPVDPIFIEEMNASHSLLNTIRLWNEMKPNSREDLLKCISKDERCPKRPSYTCGRQRSLDGTCNNPHDSTLGASFTTYSRMFWADFEDGIYSIRRSKFSKSELPSPRIVNNKIYAEQERRAASERSNSRKQDVNKSNEWDHICNGQTSYTRPISHPWKNPPREYLFNFAGYMFGQLVAVDTANRIITKNADRTAPGIQCCRNPHELEDGMAKEISNPACLPIVYPADDPFYGQFNASCGNFVRGATMIPPSCKMNHAEYGNAPTSYTDISGVYGVDQETSNSLRSYKDGKMVTNEFNVLPENEGCTVAGCYRAGDFRVNQSPPLAQWHSIFFRNHNRICELIAAQSPSWNDERLFKECRRINIAIYQHILFNEYLPLLLKKDYSYEYGILCDRTKSPDCDKYQSDIDPRIIIEFTQGAGRGIHVCIPDDIYVRAESGKVEQKYAFSDVFGVTNILNSQYDGLLRGALCQPIPCTNISYSNEIRNRMFKLKNGMGFDLFSIDINRARDNGLPPYHVLYTKCTGREVRHWNDLGEHFDDENLELMSNIYESVYDMDALPGTLMERRDHSLMGVVARCMTAEQFHRLKYGDRYFYSFVASPTPFTGAQIDEIEKMSVAKLMCQTTNLKSVPQHAFLVESKSNTNVLCKNYRDFDFSLWKKD